MANNLCIIPARGGSKRIPRKNIKDFLGKPIMAYSIEAALKSNLFSEVIVSTDDDEIKEVALRYGAKVPFMRSEKNSDDFATTIDVIREVVEEYEKNGKYFDHVCCIYATAPFVSEKALIASGEIFKKNRFDTLFPVLRYGFPIQRSLHMEMDKVKFNWPENANKRSQDLEPAYHDSGQFYWMTIDAVKSAESMVTPNSGGYVITELDAQDIDSEIDWKMAELKYRLIHESISR